MSTNKNALIRYKILDNCFRNQGKKYFIYDLIFECEKVLLELDCNSNGISRKQIYVDIAFMESNDGWNIELNRLQEGKRVFYRYANPEFSINNMPLSEIEINQLSNAISILTQFKGMPQFDWIHELIPKLKQGINVENKNHSIIEFDNNQYLKGIDLLGTLYNAIFYKKVLLIKYAPFESETHFNFEIHPYYLKQYNSRWFLFGFNAENQKHDWNLALDRILEVKEVNKKYHVNKIIDWLEYFEDIIGVTKQENSEIENITLHFFGKTGNYIETKPLHGSQKAKWINGQTLEVNLSLIINYEFERLILSYADSVKVLKPIKLRKIVIAKLQNTMKLYS